VRGSPNREARSIGVGLLEKTLRGMSEIKGV
jgi:hypothetical protein